MMARPSRFSAATALAFIATSMQPRKAPITAIAMASSRRLGDSTTSSRVPTASSANRRSARRDPMRAITAPEKDMATTAPTPRPKISRPSVNSVMSWRGSSSGICVAQDPKRNPLARNMAATAQRPRTAA